MKNVKHSCVNQDFFYRHFIFIEAVNLFIPPPGKIIFKNLKYFLTINDASILLYAFYFL